MARHAISRRTIFAPLALLTVLGFVTASLAFYNINVSRQSRDWVIQSHKVIEAAQNTFAQVQNVESGARGYNASGDPMYLEDYDAGMAGFPVAADRLQDLVRDNAAQSERVEQLRSLLAFRVALAEERVTLTRTGQQEQALTIRPGSGKAAMDSARLVLNEVIASEEALLAQRTDRVDRVENAGVLIALVAGLFAICGLVYMFITVVRVNRDLGAEIDAREEAEAARQKSDALYRAVFENAGDYLFVIEAVGGDEFRLLDGNKAFAEGSGYPIERLRGRSIRKLQPGELGDDLNARYAKVVSDGRQMYARTEVPLPDGIRVWESTLVPVPNEDGIIDRIVGVSRDITAREEEEAQRRNAQKMEAIGRLTGGVAHDFNNLLQVIRGNLELVAQELPAEGRSAGRIRSAMHGADQAASLTRQLLSFARRQALEPEVINLGEFVEELAGLMARTLGDGIEVRTALDGGLWNTLADPAQVESAILNMALNARDAMKGEGDLSIEVQNFTAPDGQYGQDGEPIEPGDYVRLSISDTGHGMSAEVLGRVFEPFYTTKGPDHGTGLGLSMVYGFVKQSHGHIQVDSEIGRGTTMHILLPRSEAEVYKVPVEESVARGGSGEIILVVEDAEMVRAATCDMLQSMGYRTLEAPNGKAALKQLNAASSIDLLLTDVVMPGQMNGPELAVQARKRRPDLPVIFASGYAEDDSVRLRGDLSNCAFLPKPYEKGDLARRLGQLLSRRTSQTVLVVEDEALVRMSAVDLLEEAGFKVVDAANAEEAIAALQGPDEIDILFTDIGLPDMKGPDLAAEAVKHRPDIKVIYATGFGDKLLPKGAPSLTKPYDRDDLERVLG